MKSLVFGIGFMLMAANVGQAVDIEYVTVGNPGNSAHETAGLGAVNHEYRISKYEITIAQYAEFLSTVAATDTHGLYNTNMENNPEVLGISRTGSSGGYVYSVVGSGNRPITYVSYYDAARFVNWLSNGKGSGDTETGVYNMSVPPVAAPNAPFWIPTENEWFKAAFYDPSINAGIDGNNYWFYPTASDNAPSNVLPDTGNNANVYDAGYTLSGPDRLTEVGAFSGSASHYGTYDQAGSVWEWTYFGAPNSGLRGGSWNSGAAAARSNFPYSAPPDSENQFIGFRIAALVSPAIPAPLRIIEITVNSGNVTLTGDNLEIGTIYHAVQATPSQLLTNTFNPVAGSEFTATLVTESAPVLPTGGAPSLFFRLVRGPIP